MFSKKFIIVIAIIAVLIGCAKSEKKKDTTTEQPTVKAKAKTVKPPSKAVLTIPRTFTASKFNNEKWLNGIFKQEKNLVLIMIDNKISTPIKVGYTLHFAAAADAIVKEVGRMDYPSYSSLFVKVDKPLDSTNDGNPNPITIVKFPIVACAYSQPGVWKNGIHLQTSGMFFIAVPHKEMSPIKIGDKLIFAGAGEATILGINRYEGEGPNSSIMITVDKPLDPVQDGAPNPITVIIPQ